MAVSYVGYSSFGALPAGAAVNDFILAQVFDTSSGIGPYTGWTQVGAEVDLGGSGYYLAWFYRVWQSGDSMPTWPGVYEETAAWRGIDTASPVVNSAVSSGSADPRTLTSLTANANGDSAIYMNGGISAGSIAVPTNYVERFDSGSDTSGGDRLNLTASQSTSGSFNGAGSVDWGACHIMLAVGTAAPTYAEAIDALGNDHRWSFDNTLNDQVGSVNGTGSGTSFVTTPICEGVTYSLLTDGLTDRVSIPTTTDINNSAQARKAVAGWFVATAVQRPPKRIYGEGDESTSFAFALGWGNNVIFEVDSASFTLQIYSDVFLADDRPYHLCLVFEGNGYGNELRAYLDGVEQLNAQPTDRQPDAATLAARGVAEFGDPAGTVGLGGAEIELEGPVNGRYNEWATFDGAAAVLTDTEIREELFEKGALPDITISTAAEATMQTALDVYADTVRADAPCCIRIEPVTGGGNFELSLDNITFNPLASIHVQYTGTGGTLTLINTNGADCSIVSAPHGGTVVVKTEVTLAVTVRDVVTNALIVGARVYIEAAAGGDLAVGTEIVNTTTNGSGLVSAVFEYSSDQPIIAWVRKGGTTPLYREGPLPGPITAAGLTETVLLIPDE